MAQNRSYSAVSQYIDGGLSGYPSSMGSVGSGQISYTDLGGPNGRFHSPYYAESLQLIVADDGLIPNSVTVNYVQASYRLSRNSDNALAVNTPVEMYSQTNVIASQTFPVLSANIGFPETNYTTHATNWLGPASGGVWGATHPGVILATEKFGLLGHQSLDISNPNGFAIYWTGFTLTFNFTLAAPTGVTTDAASVIGQTSVNLNGTIGSAFGTQAYPTSWYFEYGPTISYGSTTATQTVSSNIFQSSFFTLAAGLTPGTLYHYRFVVTNADNTVFGADRTFTTNSDEKVVLYL